MKEPIEWEKLYNETEPGTMPWYYPELDPDVKSALQEMKITGGAVLDIGTGPGTQAMALARADFKVTATDISASAIRLCRGYAKKQGLSIDFQVEDVLQSRVRPAFDIILDRGCFHALSPNQRHSYRDIVKGLLAPSGVFFLKCFNMKETMEGGPYRFSPDEIRDLFSPNFRVLSIEETVYQGTLTPLPKALFVIMRGLQ